MNKIAFIIPNYNNEKYLMENLPIFEDLQFEYEIIIVNDLSPNVDKIKLKLNNKTKLIDLKENLGLGFARNEGIKYISKEVTHVVFVDADDKIIPQTYNDIFPNLNKQINVFFKTHIRETEKGRFLFNKKRYGITKENIPHVIWGHILKRDIAEKNKFRRRVYEDGDITLDIFNQGNIIFVNEPAIIYNRIGSSITMSKMTPEKFRDLVSMHEYIFKNGGYTSFKQKMDPFWYSWNVYFKNKLKGKVDTPKYGGWRKILIPLIRLVTFFKNKK